MTDIPRVTRAPGSPLSLTGATAATRYVGATASGAPLSGTFAVGDYVIDQTGQIWTCITAGSPGTWQVAGSGTELAFASNTNVSAPSFTTEADVTGVTITFTVGSRPVYVHCRVAVVAHATLNGNWQVKITDGSNVETDRAQGISAGVAGAPGSPNMWERISAAGTYTRKMRASNNATSGTVTVYTSIAQGAWIRAITA